MEILKYGNNILTLKSKPVKAITDDIHQIIQNMKECLINTPGGIGLAAPQVGILLQISIINLSILNEFSKNDKFTIINPKIISKNGTIKEPEGCLSFPGITTIIKRHETIKVKYRNENWDEKLIEVDGFLARAFQHEIDHLNGILIISRISSIKKQLMKREIAKLKSNNEW